eukprot:snap_masked-scaffold_103-processed-gene-0.9-mRNA-1 protein AED:1.00 eAED:1.00 QI:0/-1/0/0/-1/1/1/0/221
MNHLAKHYEAAEKITRQSIVTRNTWLLSGDVRRVNWSKMIIHVIRRFGGTFDIVLANPPWKVSKKDPVRGLSLSYDTLRNDEIKRIPLKLLVKNGYFMCWVAKSTREAAIQWANKQGFEYKQLIYWIKRSRREEVQVNTGSLVHSVMEELPIFRRGSVPVTQRILFFGSDVIESPRLPNNQKPDELKRRITNMFRTGRYLELFARNESVTPSWIAMGTELS